jgi:hypothetical protein
VCEGSEVVGEALLKVGVALWKVRRSCGRWGSPAEGDLADVETLGNVGRLWESVGGSVKGEIRLYGRWGRPCESWGKPCGR